MSREETQYKIILYAIPNKKLSIYQRDVNALVETSRASCARARWFAIRENDTENSLSNPDKLTRTGLLRSNVMVYNIQNRVSCKLEANV